MALALLASAPSFAQSAAITAPTALAEATLNNAQVTVVLSGTTFASGVTASSFTLTTSPPLTGLSIATTTTVVAGATSTLTLGYGGANFDAVSTLSVTVAAAAHAQAGALTTPTVNIVPTPSFRVSATSLSLTEGGNGTYTVVLGGQPTGPVSVAVSSDNPAVTVGGGATSTTVAFTTQNWNIARTVTATAEGDVDAVDEYGTISNAVSGGGYWHSANVRVVVADDEIQDRYGLRRRQRPTDRDRLAGQAERGALGPERRRLVGKHLLRRHLLRRGHRHGLPGRPGLGPEPG